MEMVLPMNSGAEAVETAIKIARKWGYEVKGVPEDRAKIVVVRRQLPRPHDHDRRLLDDPVARGGFGPFTPGFVTVPFGDADALEAAIDADTVAFLSSRSRARRRASSRRPATSGVRAAVHASGTCC